MRKEGEGPFSPAHKACHLSSFQRDQDTRGFHLSGVEKIASWVPRLSFGPSTLLLVDLPDLADSRSGFGEASAFLAASTWNLVQERWILIWARVTMWAFTPCKFSSPLSTFPQRILEDSSSATSIESIQQCFERSRNTTACNEKALGNLEKQKEVKPFRCKRLYSLSVFKLSAQR